MHRIQSVRSSEREFSPRQRRAVVSATPRDGDGDCGLALRFTPYVLYYSVGSRHLGEVPILGRRRRSSLTRDAPTPGVNPCQLKTFDDALVVPTSTGLVDGVVAESAQAKPLAKPPRKAH